jgi:hypothetical protein
MMARPARRDQRKAPAGELGHAAAVNAGKPEDDRRRPFRLPAADAGSATSREVCAR